jgi:hypothetical protein
MSILTSPYTLYTTSLSSFLISRYIINHVQKKGPISFAARTMKFNNAFYSLFSLALFICISSSYVTDLSTTPTPLSLKAITCTKSHTDFDQKLRLIYHVSKIYEYIDIFNVLAVGGEVNTHFGVHHFTVRLRLFPPFSSNTVFPSINILETPYLTYSRVILHPIGWKLFALLNTFHHSIMYAYFGGMTIFSDLLPWTGSLQLVLGLLGEVFVLWGRCGGKEGVWASGVAMALLGTYGVLFAGDLMRRGEKDEKVKKEGKETKAQ